MWPGSRVPLGRGREPPCAHLLWDGHPASLPPMPPERAGLSHTRPRAPLLRRAERLGPSWKPHQVFSFYYLGAASGHRLQDVSSRGPNREKSALCALEAPLRVARCSFTLMSNTKSTCMHIFKFSNIIDAFNAPNIIKTTEYPKCCELV